MYALVSKKSLFRSAACIMAMFSLLSACSSGSSGSSAPETQNLTVKSIYPANNDTQVGIATSILVNLYNNIDSSQISAHLIPQDNPNDLNPPIIPIPPIRVFMKMSGSGNSYSFTPESMLMSNTTYKFTVKIKGSGNNTEQSLSSTTTTSSSTSSSTFTTQPSYKIFTTSGGYKGNLQGTAANAVSGADAICNADAANPDKTQYYKAMLTANTQRYPCSTDGNFCGASYSYDWVLQATNAYFDLNGNQIATANGQSVFTFDLSKPFDTTGNSNNVWTGLTDNWGSSGDGDSCKGWTSSSSGNKGKCGRSGQVGVGSISNDKQDCNGSRKLYCVMQPSAALTNPLVGSTISNLSTTISVIFNLVGGVNSASVNSTTFSVIESSAYQTGRTLAGTISSSNGVFTFTPSTPLLGGKTYSVSLSSGITSNNGVPLTPTTLSFMTAGSTKLIFSTADEWWGDLAEAGQKINSAVTTGINGADALCQADAQCPAGNVCKAIISDAETRIACVLNSVEDQPPLCGANYSKDWVLSANTYYVNTAGADLGLTDANGVFNFVGGFQFNVPLANLGKSWTGLTKAWTSDKDGTCEKWTKGDSGVNQIGGLLGYPDEINYTSIGSGNAGGCSQYNNDTLGVKTCISDGIDGCSKRHLYCATQ